MFIQTNKLLKEDNYKHVLLHVILVYKKMNKLCVLNVKELKVTVTYIFIMVFVLVVKMDFIH